MYNFFVRSCRRYQSSTGSETTKTPTFQSCEKNPFKSFSPKSWIIALEVIYSEIDKADANQCEHNHTNLLQLERKMCKRHVNNLGNNLGCITGENTIPKSNLTFNHFIM